MTEPSMDDADRVELVWPGKSLNVRVSQTKDGKWSTGQLTHKGELRGFSVSERVGTSSSGDVSLVITGDRHDAMRALRRAVGPAFKLIYLDLPRLNVDDAETAFQSSSTKRLTTWLAVVRAFLLEARALLARQGVVAVHCGEQEAQYARMILDELFRDKRVGTIIWQKTYSARNMPGMKEFTDAHDLIYLYARDKDALGPVALRRSPKGYRNADSDPRGAWKAEHKGAKTRRENSDFNTFQPPYRWRLISGTLPQGIWRVSPFTGVIWGKPSIPGAYAFTVEVTDQSGATARKKLSIDVTPLGVPAVAPDIPWIFEELSTKGTLAVATTELPNGVVGQVYSAVLFAQGGTPFKGEPIRPGSGRYWDFAKNTLIAAYQADAVHLGSRQPTAIPTPKKYEPRDGVETENQQSIWLGRTKGEETGKAEVLAGYTEDATKHLKALKALGFIENEVSTSKPEPLLDRLQRVFTAPGDLVLEPLGTAADLAAVALKSERRFVTLLGGTDHDREVSASCAVPRLRACVEGKDQALEEQLTNTKLVDGSYLWYAGGRGFIIAELGPVIATLSEGDDLPDLSDQAIGMNEGDLASAILSSEGYLDGGKSAPYASSIAGAGRAKFLGPSEFLTPELASKIASEIRDAGMGPLTVFYFRSTDDLDEADFEGQLILRRVPFDLLRPEAV